MKKQSYLVTAALPYANGPLHLGHLAGAYLPSDIFVKYKRMCGDDVVYICGTDEHGVPITIKAEQLGITPQQLVDENYHLMKKTFEKLNINFSLFSRTSNKIHHETAQEFFTDIYNNGFLEAKETEQVQCQSCYTFLADRYIEGTCPVCKNPGARGDQCEKCGSMLNPSELIDPICKVCNGKTIKPMPTTHFYLKLPLLQEKIESWINSKVHWKENVVNYCKNWFKEGLADRAVTRDMKWGIQVPIKGFEDKVLYVWFDAPIGYVSMTKEWAIAQKQPDLWRNYWQNPECKLIHFIGKDNIVFHSIIFPAMLIAKNDSYILPDNVPANEFLNLEGDKLSTSRNYAVWVHEYLEKFSADALRYYLATILPETKDSDFSWKNYQQTVNSELADVFGNFINRTFTFNLKFFEGKVPPTFDLDSNDQNTLSRISTIMQDVSFHLDRFENRKALETIAEFGRLANKYFNDQEPWKTRTSNPEKCQTTLHISLQICKKLALLLAPFVPETSEKLWQMLNANDHVLNADWFNTDALAVGHNLNAPSILFTKIEDEAIAPEIERLYNLKRDKVEDKAKEEITVQAIKAEISIDDFAKIDLRTATILTAEKIEGSKKLLKLSVDLGFEKRQVVSGIAEHFKVDDLIGKKVTLVANLKPVKLKGVESQGMILAIEQNGKLEILSPSENIINGLIIK